jgi:hypothetical protein
MKTIKERGDVSMAKVLVHPHDEVAHDAAMSCPVKECDCGCSTFRFFPGNFNHKEGYECVECEEFYVADNWIRTPQHEISDAHSGL